MHELPSYGKWLLEIQQDSIYRRERWQTQEGAIARRDQLIETANQSQHAKDRSKRHTIEWTAIRRDYQR